MAEREFESEQAFIDAVSSALDRAEATAIENVLREEKEKEKHD